MFADFFSPENLFESTLVFAVVSFLVGLFVAYLIWGITSGRVFAMERIAKSNREQSEHLQQERDALKLRLDDLR